MGKTLADIKELASFNVDSAWSINSEENGTVKFRFEQGRFRFESARKPDDFPISDTVYQTIYNHCNRFAVSKKIG